MDRYRELGFDLLRVGENHCKVDFETVAKPRERSQSDIYIRRFNTLKQARRHFALVRSFFLAPFLLVTELSDAVRQTLLEVSVGATFVLFRTLNTASTHPFCIRSLRLMRHDARVVKMKSTTSGETIMEHLNELGKVLENMAGLAHDGEFYLSEIARALGPKSAPLTELKTRARLLLVDDDGLLLKSLAKIFRVDFEVVTASALEPALAKLERQEFDVVLSDFHLPDGSGLMILEAARRRYPGACRILYTATAADAKIIAKAQAEGLVQRLFLKPVAAEELRAAMLEMLADEHPPR
jgi:CheY-like chemotaxis protein